jgi:hypothetical protein
MKRFIYVTSILVSVLMFVVGVGMISVGLMRLIHDEPNDPANSMLAVFTGSVMAFGGWRLLPMEHSRGVFQLLKGMVVYGVWFTIVGTVLGMAGGALGGGIYEYMTGASGGNGPLLFFITAPLGCLIGMFYGIWKEARS